MTPNGKGTGLTMIQWVPTIWREYLRNVDNPGN